ncbi:MAG: DNA (cytosine-5)-methyltransferase 1 [Haloarculaceae archaeon]|jgi:DNA (cytosine-5)-methyltransferase 1
MTGETIRAVDLFCGAGGLSWALVEALQDVAIDADQPRQAVLEDVIDLVGVNHWEQAIETHRVNHPWARHFHDDIQNINPREVFDDPDPAVKILSGGIECTHWSTARGGKPVDDQKRMPAWDFLTWVQKLRPENVLVENVPEFESWGPIDEDGQPTRSGETFDSWIDSLHSLGYSVDWEVLNAADYGDATSRKRLFVMATREGTPSFPEPTHSKHGAGDTQEWRSAAEIIDWSDPGGSIWTRDLDDGRKRPLKNSTMQRIAEGIRRHCGDRLDAFADILEEIGREDVKRLREHPVPAEYAGVAADVLDGPFLVAHKGSLETAAGESVLPKYYGTSTARPVDAPVDTISSGGQKYALASPYLLRQQSGGVPAHVDGAVPTVSAAGAIGKIEPRPLVMPRNGARRGLHSNPLYPPEERPLQTVTAQNTDGYVVGPSLVRYSHGGASLDVDQPMPTIATEKGGVFALSAPSLWPLLSPSPTQTLPVVEPFIDDYEGPAASLKEPLGTVTSKDRFALFTPELHPWGLDVRFRMLQPRELKRAQGFPDDYEIHGTKTDTTRQIGNAVPVNLAQNLVESLLSQTMPALKDYIDTGSASGTDAGRGPQLADD